MKAMILAAGLGTRLKEETADKPKALVEIGGKTMLERVIENLKQQGITEIVVNVHHFPDLIISFLNNHDFKIPVHISDERDKLLDTGGGLKKASPLLYGREPVILHNVDIISNINLAEAVEDHLRTRAIATLIVRERKSQRYLIFNNDRSLVGWTNKKSGELIIADHDNFHDTREMSFTGIHIISPELFKYMPQKEAFPIIDLYLKLARERTIKGFYDNSEQWADIGTPEELRRARKMI